MSIRFFRKGTTASTCVAAEPTRVHSNITFSTPVWVPVNGTWINSCVIESYLRHNGWGQLHQAYKWTFFDKTFHLNGITVGFYPDCDNASMLQRIAAAVSGCSRSPALESVIFDAWKERTEKMQLAAQQGVAEEIWLNW